MKNKRIAKILSLVLVLVMAVSLLPVSASAESYRSGAAQTNRSSYGWGGWWNWGWWNWGWNDPEPEPEPEEPVVEEPTEPTEPEEPVVEEPTEPEEPVEDPAPVEEPVVVDPVIETNYSADINGITVNVDTEDGAFSEPVTLSVSAIEAGSGDYQAAEDALTEMGHEYDGMLAFDIHFNSVANGGEVEPNGTVNVTMSVTSSELSGIPADAADSIVVTHIAEDGAEVVATPDETVPGTVDVTVENEVVAEVAADFDVDSFSTYTISWYYNGYKSYKVHYVDTNGNSLTPTRTPTFTNNYMFLIYDIEGYEYDSCHYGSRTGTAIPPLLRIDSYYDRQYINSNTWSDLRNDIYVVYKAKAAVPQGGTPSTDQTEEWPSGNNAPQFSKSSTNNGNGTNTIALSIKAAEKPVQKSTPADVIVVFDVSGSMSDNMSGQTRLARAKTAVNTMANTLLNGDNKDVRMALISFSTTTATVQGFTNNYSTYSSKVNGLSADGGTNWEKALYEANHLQVRDNAATFVVFVTDGDPTFRMSRGDVSDADLDLYSDSTYQYYRNNSVFGEGNDDSEGRNFSFAVEQVKAIKAANKNFYAIGISNDVTKVQNLTTQGGVAANHAFIASDSTAMNNAFKSITESIQSILGFGGVEMTDGITALTNSEMKGGQPLQYRDEGAGGCRSQQLPLLPLRRRE